MRPHHLSYIPLPPLLIILALLFAHAAAAHTEIELHACCTTTLEHCTDARPPAFSEACRAGHRVLDSGCDAPCCIAHALIFDFCPGIIGCGSDPCPCVPDIPSGSVTEIANGIDDDCDGFVDDEQCDNVDNDGDGMVDEDIGSCLMRILFVPLEWQDTQAAFENTALIQLSAFLTSLDLNACPDNFGVQFLHINDINLPEPDCSEDCGAGKLREVFVNSSSVNINEFDVVAAVTDDDLCDSTAGCSNRQDFIWLETDENIVLAHELGHMLQLGDEYCSTEAGSTCLGCNDGANPPPNFLGSDLGCDPREGEGCCGDCSGDEGMCVDDREVCCAGNLNDLNGRCIMAAVDADEPRAFCDRCYQWATNPLVNVRSASFPDGQAPMTCAFAHLGNMRSLNMDYDLGPDGDMSVKSASTGVGRFGIAGPGSAGQFKISVLDSQGSLLYESSFDATFRPDPQFSGVDYSQIHHQTVSRGLRAALPDSVVSTKIVLSKDDLVTSQTCLVSGAMVGGRVEMEADSIPPDISCPSAIEVECSAHGGTPATDAAIAAFLAGATATDDCDPNPSITTNAPALFGLGTTVVTFVATDADGNSDSGSTCEATVTVVDTMPPDIENLAANPAFLWPPNHKMIPVSIGVTVTDVCDPSPVCAVDSISSNEPVNGTGDGNTAPDWQITGSLAANLRAERSGKGNGRTYSIGVTCTDQSDNSAMGSAAVPVAHDSR